MGKWRGLIASDVDGTLLMSREEAIPEAVFPLIREALANDIMFAVASGRDYASLAKLFAPVKDEIYFISTNGSQLIYRDELLIQHSFPREDAELLTVAIEERPDLVYLISTSDNSYMKNNHDVLAGRLIEDGYNLHLIEDIREITDPIIKVAAYCPGSAMTEYTHFAGSWSEKFRVAVSGNLWIDFNSSDKGRTLTEVASLLDLSHERVVAFGDQFNDLTMLQYAGRPYLMATAHPELLKFGFPTTDDVLAELPKAIAWLQEEEQA